VKSTNGFNIKIVDLKEYSSNEIGLLVQAVLTEVMIIFAILSLFVKDFLNSFYVILSLGLFTMSYNNKKIYKKKNMSAIYIILGLFILATVLMEYIF